MYTDKMALEDLYSIAIEDNGYDSLAHVGRSKEDGAPGPGSGRYPLGSGDDPFQHSGNFISRVEELKKKGLNESQIAEAMGIVNQAGKPSSTNLRTQLSLAKAEQRTQKAITARSLRDQGYTLQEITDKMGFKNDSSVRSLLNEQSEIRMNQAKATADILKKHIDAKRIIDVGSGVEVDLNVSKEKLNQALYILEMQGYKRYGGRVPQPTNPKQQTTLKCICAPDVEHKEIFDYDKVKSVKDYITRDGGDTFEKKFHYPESMDSSRLMIRYAEDGGILKDGLIELRRNVPDLSLGESHYSQVRILVDGKKYIKGMAKYSDDMPDGVDVVFNTNKSKDVAKLDVLKDIKKDPDNPFGSSIKPAEQGGQYWYTDPKTGKKKLGLINKRSDEGDWSEWKDKLPSQFLSKQSTSLAKKQLGLAAKESMDEYKAISELNNPTVKKKLLQDFSDGCDYAAVHLYAAALPRQKYHVIIPISAMNDKEIYAPRYKTGEQVALIRYPHGGTFEIPILTVNNNHRVAKNVLGPDVVDAVGINSKVAERLSGADFDGDTVMVIPTNDKVRIKSTNQLKGLEGFDPKMKYGTKKVDTGTKDPKTGDTIYKYYNSSGNEIKVMKNTQNEMGKISNLITDMTLLGAKPDELARAVRHSMVVIDAEKHKLDYKSSYQENRIDELKKKYQVGGASTLLSRAKSQTSIPKTQGSPKVNMKYNRDGTRNPDYDPKRPEGALIYKNADELYYPVHKYNKETNTMEYKTVDGKTISYTPTDQRAKDRYYPVKKVDPRTGAVSFTNKDGTIKYKVDMKREQSDAMSDTDDARTLISKANTPMEQLYADYANTMKHLANQARKEMMTTGKIEYSKKASLIYKDEVHSLDEQLKKAKQNKPRERQALLIANSVVAAKKKENEGMTKGELKKLNQRELTKARQMVGAHRTTVKITPKEWEAIQAGAISETKLKEILNNADMDIVRELATPRQTTELSSYRISRIKAMQASGLTINQISNAIGVSTSTVVKYMK